MSDVLDLLIPALVLVTFVLSVGVIVAWAYMERVYRQRTVDNAEMTRQMRWVRPTAVLALLIAGAAVWALLRFAFPDLELAGLPAPWTIILIILAVDVGLARVINTARTWRNWRRQGLLDA